jgi:hypothetical protein
LVCEREFTPVAPAKGPLSEIVTVNAFPHSPAALALPHSLVPRGLAGKSIIALLELNVTLGEPGQAERCAARQARAGCDQRSAAGGPTGTGERSPWQVEPDGAASTPGIRLYDDRYQGPRSSEICSRRRAGERLVTSPVLLG